MRNGGLPHHPTLNQKGTWLRNSMPAIYRRREGYSTNKSNSFPWTSNFCLTCIGLWFSQGIWPVRSSQSTTPYEYTSARSSYLLGTKLSELCHAVCAITRRSCREMPADIALV